MLLLQHFCMRLQSGMSVLCMPVGTIVQLCSNVEL
jgi:hypothetical protein